VLEDGFQNPDLRKDLSLVVVDGGYGFGNGRTIPAGPLREPVAAGLARAAAVVLIGEDRSGARGAVTDAVPILTARLVPTAAPALSGARVVAFAGIGRPQKFFETLEEIGCDLAERRAFADHHPYTEAEALGLCELADRANAIAVTTEKAVPYTHLRPHETVLDLVCRLQLEKTKVEVKFVDIGRNINGEGTLLDRY